MSQLVLVSFFQTVLLGALVRHGKNVIDVSPWLLSSFNKEYWRKNRKLYKENETNLIILVFL